MGRPMHGHGTRACGARGCERTECREAHLSYRREYEVTRRRLAKAAARRATVTR